MPESSNAVEVTKPGQRTSKAMLQAENDIEDTVAALLGKPNLDFHPEINRQLQETPQQCLKRETTSRNDAIVDTDIMPGRAFARSTCAGSTTVLAKQS